MAWRNFIAAGVLVVALGSGHAAAQVSELGQVASLLASDGAPDDNFGHAVAVDGDTAVIGAPYDDTSTGSNVGGVYVFVRSGTTWSLQAKLAAADKAAGDQFGYSVAISGDTMVVGARGDDMSAGTNAGSAYLFKRSGTAWTQQAKLTPAVGGADHSFGSSVAIDGGWAVIGAPEAFATWGGAAYIFRRQIDLFTGVTTWEEKAELMASDGDGYDEFGSSVDISGETAVVGAPDHDTGAGSDAGAAYIFVRSGTAWTEQDARVASDGAAGDLFGWSVAISGETVLVGARADDTLGGIDAGSVYLLTRTGTAWSEEPKLTASPGGAGNYFGYSVAIDGDTAMVGAVYGGASPSLTAGSAYAFVRAGTAWTQQAKLGVSGGSATDYFGAAVAIEGDTIVVGAPLDDTAKGADAGSAFVFGPVPLVPTILTATEISPGTARITWKDNSLVEDRFEIQRQSKSGGVWGGSTTFGPFASLTGSGTTGTWDQAPGSGSWRYRVRAANSMANSGWTGYLVVKPAIPTSVATILAGGTTGRYVKLTWLDRSGFEQGFNIQRQHKVGTSWLETTAIGTGLIGANAISFTDTTIAVAGNYRYRIASFNNGGSSAWTSWKTVTVP